MPRKPQPDQLSDFLRARRAQLQPGDVGLADAGRVRRVAGLRREEVASLAAISIDYYTRLEQGRIHPSPTVLASLARALRLDDSQQNYLFELAGLTDEPQVRAQAQEPQLLAFLDDLTHTPAFVIGPRTEVVAWNAMGAALITDFAAIPEERRQYIRLLVTDPRMRELYADWEDVTQLAIAQMRKYTVSNPDDATLTTLVAELSGVDEDFRRWWADHHVAYRTAGLKRLRHPVVGDLDLHWSAITWNANPDLQIIVWTADPGTESHHRLRRLAAMANASHRDFSGRSGTSSQRTLESLEGR